MLLLTILSMRNPFLCRAAILRRIKTGEMSKRRIVLASLVCGWIDGFWRCRCKLSTDTLLTPASIMEFTILHPWNQGLLLWLSHSSLFEILWKVIIAVAHKFALSEKQSDCFIIWKDRLAKISLLPYNAQSWSHCWAAFMDSPVFLTKFFCCGDCPKKPGGDRLSWTNTRRARFLIEAEGCVFLKLFFVCLKQVL